MKGEIREFCDSAFHYVTLHRKSVFSQIPVSTSRGRNRKILHRWNIYRRYCMHRWNIYRRYCMHIQKILHAQVEYMQKILHEQVEYMQKILHMQVELKVY